MGHKKAKACSTNGSLNGLHCLMESMSDVIVIGSGMGGLTAAACLAKAGKKVCVLEQNYLPGGCTSTYYRKGFQFEAGATTLVGLSEGMPLQKVLDFTGISLSAIALDLPMQVFLADGTCIQRYATLEPWIEECEKIFGAKGQRAFWEQSYAISRSVWQVSTRQSFFPPERWLDLVHMLKAFRPAQLRMLPSAFITMDAWLRRFGLEQNTRFVRFVNEQLMITAQNTASEVNALFGAAALCYTLYPNYYMPGGLIAMVNPFVDFLKENGSAYHHRTRVLGVHRLRSYFRVHTDKGDFLSKKIVCGIPINNFLELIPESMHVQRIKKKVLPSPKLNGAFTIGLGIKGKPSAGALHRQFHLPSGIGVPGANSLFVSFSHPEDATRAPEGHCVASVSCHVHDPAHAVFDKEAAAQRAIAFLLENKLFEREQIVYMHASSPKTWEDWTLRKFGFVGGYPQMKSVKPWQMISARFGKDIYLCGDSVYPGQGIPGVSLSGWIAFQKLMADERPFKSLIGRV